jgi:hypothetical protein
MVQEKMQCWKTWYRWTDQISVFLEAVVRSTYLEIKKIEKLFMVQEKMQCWKTWYRCTDEISVFVEAVVRSTYLEIKKKNKKHRN